MFEFEGEVDWPLPKRAVIIMKYFLGFRTWSSPMSHSLSAIAGMVSYASLGEGGGLTSRVPCGIDDCWRGRVSKSFVGNLCARDGLAGLKFPVSEFVNLNF